MSRTKRIAGMAVALLMILGIVIQKTDTYAMLGGVGDSLKGAEKVQKNIEEAKKEKNEKNKSKIKEGEKEAAALLDDFCKKTNVIWFEGKKMRQADSPQCQLFKEGKNGEAIAKHEAYLNEEIEESKEIIERDPVFNPSKEDEGGGGGDDAKDDFGVSHTSAGFFTSGDNMGVSTVCSKSSVEKIGNNMMGGVMVGDTKLTGDPESDQAAISKNMISDKEKEGLNWFGKVKEWAKNKLTDFLFPLFHDLMVAVSNQLLTPDCSKEFSFTFPLLKIVEPVNLTNNRPIMKIVAFTQTIALGGAALLIVAYGIMHTTGFQRVDPLRFFVRMMFAIFAVGVLPYLMQDVLNINNLLVGKLAGMDVGGNAVVGVAGSGMILILVASIAAFIGALVGASSIAIAASGGTLGIFIAAVILVLLVLIIIPIVRLFVWWFVRLILIFLLAVLGPFFVILLGLPQTAKYAKKWMLAFIGETFSQVFVALGVFLFASIWANIKEFNEATNLTFMGDIALFSGMILFVAGIPKLAKDLIGGVSNPGEQAIKEATAGIAGFGAALASLGIGAVANKARNSESKGLERDQAGTAETSIGGDDLGFERPQVTEEALESYRSSQAGSGAGSGPNEDKKKDDDEESKNDQKKNPSNDSSQSGTKDGTVNPPGGSGSEPKKRPVHPLLSQEFRTELQRIKEGFKKGDMSRTRAVNGMANALIRQGAKKEEALKQAESIMQRNEAAKGSWNERNLQNKERETRRQYLDKVGKESGLNVKFGDASMKLGNFDKKKSTGEDNDDTYKDMDKLVREDDVPDNAKSPYYTGGFRDEVDESIEKDPDDKQ